MERDKMREIYSKVREHLLTQGRKSTEINGMDCLYRAQNGDRCAIGCLIPDEIYVPGMECHSIGYIFDFFPEVRPHLGFVGRTRDHDGLEFLGSLQEVHDNYGVPAWPVQLSSVARKFGIIDEEDVGDVT